jgi:iron complex outermembrane receptor protein
MKRTLLSLLVSSVLLHPLAAQAQGSPPAEDDTTPATRQLDTVTVTGSLIPRAQIEGPSPVTT